MNLLRPPQPSHVSASTPHTRCSSVAWSHLVNSARGTEAISTDPAPASTSTPSATVPEWTRLEPPDGREVELDGLKRLGAHGRVAFVGVDLDPAAVVEPIDLDGLIARVGEPVVPDALASVDAPLLPAILRLRALRDHLTDPVGRQVDVGGRIIGEEIRGHTFATPARELGNNDVRLRPEVKLGLNENDPAPRVVADGIVSA